MRTANVPVALLAAALAACGPADSSTITAPAAPAPARAAAAALPMRPLAGSCETVLAPTQFVRPGVIRQVDTGVCHLSHLGRTRFYSTKLINVVAGTQTTEATFTAANGDVLRAVGAGTNTPAGPGRADYAATLTFTGGSGRFARATGRATVRGQADLVARTSALTLEGSVAYAAADRGAR